jgi:cell division septation protein DedD
VQKSIIGIKNYTGGHVTVQQKQRIVGIIVLAFLAIIVLPLLFGHNEDEQRKNIRVNDSIQLKKTPRVSPVSEVSQRKKRLSGNDMNFALKNGSQDAQWHQYVPEHEEKIAPPAQSLPLPNLLQSRRPILNSGKLERIESKIITNKQVPEDSTGKIKIQPLKYNIKLHVTHDKAKLLAIKRSHLEQGRSHNQTAEIKNLKLNRVAREHEHPSAENVWTIQLGSFANKNNVNHLVQELKNRGFPVYLRRPGQQDNANSIIRVFVGHRLERTKAELTVQKIQQLFDLHGVVVKDSI